MQTQIAQIIKNEVNRFPAGEPLAEALRAAAWFVMEDFPEASSGDFGTAAELCGLHRQGAMNRWNEAVKNLKTAG